MVDSLGLRVASLHRVSFCGVNLKGLAEGNWAELSEAEMAVINAALDRAGDKAKVFDDPEE
jgi:16S rRNA U516 pseudouridylate synthase RsuA-like enzyme